MRSGSPRASARCCAGGTRSPRPTASARCPGTPAANERRRPRRAVPPHRRFPAPRSVHSTTAGCATAWKRRPVRQNDPRAVIGEGGATMPESWSPKRERQYQHIKDSQLDKGASEEEAEEIAARTVNKTRAQEGESDEAARASLEDKPPSERGGERSHSGSAGRTKAQLYEDARRQGVEGRSTMSKDELEDALEDR